MIRIASYNVHGGIGRDRRCSPERIRDVIREIDPDVIALQEVESSANGIDMFEWLAAETGLNAIAADVDCGGLRVHVVATHLGLRPAERRFQVERLLKLFTATKKDREVLLGDLNEWYLWGRPLRKLRTYFDQAPAPATFPSRHPLFALDRIYVSPRSMLKELTVHSSALARLASDHLPVVATLDLS